MGQFDKIFSSLVFIGLVGFAVLNAKNVTALATGLTGSAVQFVGGVRGTGTG